MRAMPIIDESGNYTFSEGTRIVATSTHPVYRARIEIPLEQGIWIGASPQAGNRLGRFKRVRASDHQIEEFQKELTSYLSAYSPEVLDTLVTSGAVQFDLSITQGALDVVV